MSEDKTCLYCGKYVKCFPDNFIKGLYRALVKRELKLKERIKYETNRKV